MDMQQHQETGKLGRAGAGAGDVVNRWGVAQLQGTKENDNDDGDSRTVRR
jgi:hypothetical protein